MIDKVVYFLYVVRTGSFSDAARKYGISASAGSRWIVELEDKMGVSLLKRSTRKVVPTQAGERLFQRFGHVYTEIDDIFTEIQNFSNSDSGVIRVACTPLFAKYFLSRIVGEYLSLHPNLSFQIIETALDVDHIESVDFAIRASVVYDGFLEKDCLLVKRSILKYPLMACCAPRYIENNTMPLVPADLKQHNCLFASTLVGGNKWVFKCENEMETFDISATVEVENSEFIRRVALEGGGIAYLPVNLIRSDLDSGRLIPVLADYMNSDFEFSLYYRPRKQMPSRCVNFKDYLLRRVQEIAEEVRFNQSF